MQRNGKPNTVLSFLMTGAVLLGCGSAGGPETVSSTGTVTAQPPLPDALPADVDPESLSRLPLRTREDMPEKDKEVYDRYVGADPGSLAGLRGPKGIRLYSPQAGWHLSRANRILRYESGLDPRNRELAILVVAREMNSQFEWTLHEREALEVGADPAAIEVVKHRRGTEGLQEKDALIIRFGREMMREPRLSSETFTRMVEAFGREDLISLTQMMGNYAATALLLRVVDQQLPPDLEPLLPLE